MRRPALVANAVRIGKAQTTSVGIKDERHRVAINPVRGNVWLRIQHVSLLCFAGIVASRFRFEPTPPAIRG
jgi:porphobilinogen deaminase